MRVLGIVMAVVCAVSAVLVLVGARQIARSRPTVVARTNLLLAGGIFCGAAAYFTEGPVAWTLLAAQFVLLVLAARSLTAAHGRSC